MEYFRDYRVLYSTQGMNPLEYKNMEVLENDE